MNHQLEPGAKSMPAPLTIVAVIQACSGNETEVERALENIIAPTLAEPGCLQYDLHRDHEKPGRFLFFENWATKAEWETHMESEHLAGMKAATDGKIDSTVIYQMEKTGS
jgi:quinol monooxygenase YgiN